MRDFTGTEDFNEVWKSAPNATLGKAIEVSVVGRRCVYLNDYRIAGGKPYASENLPHHELTTTLGDVISAFSEDDLLAAIAERKQRDEYFAAWRAARDASQVEQS